MQYTHHGAADAHPLEELLKKIETNTRQYVRVFAEAADKVMPVATRTDIPSDVFDVLLEQVRFCTHTFEV